MSIPSIMLNQVVTVQRATTTYSPLGESLQAWQDVQTLKARILSQQGSPDFRLAAGRVDTSTHRIIYDCFQLVPVAGGLPYQTTRVPSDVQLSDRIKDSKGQTYLVDFVEDVENEHDHFEARLTLFTPGGQSL